MSALNEVICISDGLYLVATVKLFHLEGIIGYKAILLACKAYFTVARKLFGIECGIPYADFIDLSVESAVVGIISKIRINRDTVCAYDDVVCSNVAHVGGISCQATFAVHVYSGSTLT